MHTVQRTVRSGYIDLLCTDRLNCRRSELGRIVHELEFATCSSHSSSRTALRAMWTFLLSLHVFRTWVQFMWCERGFRHWQLSFRLPLCVGTGLISVSVLSADTVSRLQCLIILSCCTQVQRLLAVLCNPSLSDSLHLQPTTAVCKQVTSLL